MATPFQRLWRQFVEWAKGHTFPGFRKQSIYNVLRFWLNDVIAIDFNMRASAMAYDFFFALFPTLIFLFSLLPYIPVSALAMEVETRLREALPPDTWQLVQPTVSNTVREANPGLLLFSIGLLLFSATRGVRTMLAAFYLSAPDTFRRRNFLETMWVSTVIFFSLGVIFLVAIGILIGGEVVLSYLADRVHLIELWGYVLLSLLTILVNLLLLYSMVAFLFYFAPAHARRWHLFSPGTILGGSLLFVAQVLLRWYFLNFGNYNKLYGTLATVIVLILWIYYNCVVLLLGFELNTAIDQAEAEDRRKKSQSDRIAKREVEVRKLSDPVWEGRARRL